MLWDCGLVLLSLKRLSSVKRCKDILTPNWAFLPDVIKKPKKELKKEITFSPSDSMWWLAISIEHWKVILHASCNRLVNPYNSWPDLLWGLLFWSIWTWSKLSSGWPRARLRTSWLVRELGGKTGSTFYVENYLFVWWNIKGISPSRFVSLLASCSCPSCVGHCPSGLVLTPSFQWMILFLPASIISTSFHSSPSPCQFPQHIPSFPSLEGFLKSVHFCSSSNHHSSHHHYLHSGLLELPLGYHSVSPFALIATRFL